MRGPAAMFVRIASRYRCEVWVEKEGEEVNGKSIMGLMMLAAGQGSKLHVRCEGAGRRQGDAGNRGVDQRRASTKIDFGKAFATSDNPHYSRTRG